MAKSEKHQQDQNNQLNEGLFSPLFKKLIQKRLKKQLKKLERNPAMRGALKRLDKATTDFERELEINGELLGDMDEKDMDREEKNLAAFYRGLGLKWRGK